VIERLVRNLVRNPTKKVGKKGGKKNVEYPPIRHIRPEGLDEVS
jgi:hypothetical protein